MLELRHVWNHWFLLQRDLLLMCVVLLVVSALDLRYVLRRHVFGFASWPFRVHQEDLVRALVRLLRPILVALHISTLSRFLLCWNLLLAHELLSLVKGLLVAIQEFKVDFLSVVEI